MAREIDLSKPLSEEERQYLIDRERWDDLRQNAEATGEDAPEPNADQGPAHSARLGDQTVQQVPDGSNPAPASLGARQRRDGSLQIKVESEDSPYEDWYKDDLKEQAGRRGLDKRGNKQELADAIRAWDEENLDDDGNVVVQASDAEDGDPDREPSEAEYTGVLADDGDPDVDEDGEPDE